MTTAPGWGWHYQFDLILRNHFMDFRILCHTVTSILLTHSQHHIFSVQNIFLPFIFVEHRMGRWIQLSAGTVAITRLQTNVPNDLWITLRLNRWLFCCIVLRYLEEKSGEIYFPFFFSYYYQIKFLNVYICDITVKVTQNWKFYVFSI